MRTAPASPGLRPTLLERLDVAHEDDCYLGCLSALLTYHGLDGPSLIGGAYSFSFSTTVPGRTFAVGASTYREIQSLIEDISGIRFQFGRMQTWNDFRSAAMRHIERGIPLLVGADTFFLPFMSKRKGHTFHALIVHGVDPARNRFHVKCAVPVTWICNGADLRLALFASSPRLSVGTGYLAIDPSGARPSLDPDGFLERAVRRMTEPAGADCPSGIAALGAFSIWFSNEVQNRSPADRKALLEQVFEQLLLLVQQRRRFHAFLLRNYGAASDMTHTFGNVATSWEIFRNTCFRSISNPVSSVVSRLPERLRVIAALEARGVDHIRKRLEIANVRSSFRQAGGHP